MQQPDLIAALVSLTGGLEPSDSTTHAELGDLRRALISSILAGQPVSDVGTPLDPVPSDLALIKELTYLTTRAQSDASETSAVSTAARVARRSTPIEASAVSGFIFGAESTWAVGVKPSRTFGPFVDKTGRPWWFDVFTFNSPLEVRRTGAADDFLVLPKGVTVSPISNRYDIPPGTIWIASSQFSPSAPANTFVGIRIKSGQMIIEGLAGLADPLIIPQAAAVTLTCALDPPSQPGPVTGPGVDATNAAATFPANASFVFGASGITSISTDAASLTAYGSTIRLTRNAIAASYDGAIGQVLIPFTPDTTSLNVASVSSTAFQPAGSAPIAAAAWGLVSTPASAASAGATSGTGSLVLITETGLTATWSGLIQGPAYLNKAYLEFDGRLLLLFAPAASNLRANQTFELWNDGVLPGRCRLDARYTKPFPLALLSDRQGFDGLSASAGVQALIDQPVTAGGTRLQPELQAGVVIVQSPTATRLLLLSTEQLDTSGRRLALALSNALITTSPTAAF